MNTAQIGGGNGGQHHPALPRSRAVRKHLYAPKATMLGCLAINGCGKTMDLILIILILVLLFGGGFGYRRYGYGGGIGIGGLLLIVLVLYLLFGRV